METTINNYGTIIMNDLPPKRKTWKRSLRIGGLYFSISNIKMRKCCDQRQFTNKAYIKKIKHDLYEANDCKCPICGERFKFQDMEIHHILPWFKYPELREDPKNMVVLCTKCHKEIHNDPWKNIRMMKAKAQELGINLEDRYELS